MDVKEIVKNWIEDVTTTGEELNELVSELNAWDGSFLELRYYDMSELDYLFCELKPLQLLDTLEDGFSADDDGFRDNGYKVESCSFRDAVADIRANAEEIAEHVEEEMENITLPDSLQMLLEEE